jgi:hypothetical protein
MAGLDPAIQQARPRANELFAPQTQRGWMGGSVTAHGDRVL